MKAVIIALIIACTITPAHAHHQSGYNYRPAKTLKFKRTRRPAMSSVSCLTPEARAILDQIQATFGPLRIVSTCRPGATIRGTNHPSYHRYGKAVDFIAPRGMKQAVVRWLINLHRGGVMTYHNFNHIHFDTGSFFVKLGARG